ncbi:hypothetical protein [Haloferula sp. BvORR071]|uniref:hypothetical protein n=1 Tax=Haloferula sp. BvORR071 TaxID=1396141 RepID=UPI002240F520|nr:hypothetical protein [Haloferula sp. BvORR071]
MTAPKSTCSTCGAEILQITAEHTGGLCMPCKKQENEERRAPPPPLQVSCVVESLHGSTPRFFATPEDLIGALEKVGSIGGDDHPNRYEVEAQLALLRHVIRVRNRNFCLNNDHWNRTGWALLTLFEQGQADFQAEAIGPRYRFADLTKENWTRGTEPLAQQGGFSYRTADGMLVFSISTWRS